MGGVSPFRIIIIVINFCLDQRDKRLRRHRRHCGFRNITRSVRFRMPIASFFLLMVIVNVVGVLSVDVGNLFNSIFTGSKRIEDVSRLLDPRNYEKDYDPPFMLRNLPLSSELMVHSTYYDVDESGTPSYLILMEVSREILEGKKIVGCGIGTLKAKSFSVRIISKEPEKKQNSDQLEVILKCPNLPLAYGKSGFVLYYITDELLVAVESQKPFTRPPPRVQPNGPYDFSLVTCVNANDKDTAWIGEFIRYQKLLGVDHVHVSVFDEYIMSGRLFEQVDTMEDVKNLVLDGFTTLTMWNNWYDKHMKVPNHFSDLIRKIDCVYQYRNTYDYVFALDSEDFFTPCGSNKNIKHYVEKYCPGSTREMSSCSFKSLQYFPGHCKLKPDSKTSLEGNVTSFLKSFTHKEMGIPKSILFGRAVIGEVNVDSSCKDCLLTGFGVVDVPKSEAYVARLDIKGRPDKDKC